MGVFPTSIDVEARLRDADILEFDGVNDIVDCQDPGITENEAFTVEFWTKTPLGESTNNWPAIYSEGTPATWLDDLFIIYCVDDAVDDSVRVYQRDGNSDGGTVLRGTTVINDGQWHHVAVVQAGLSDRKLYIDAVLEDSNITTLLALVVTDAYIGAADNDGTKTRFCQPNTLIKEVRLWSDERTLAEIKANMYYELDGDEAGLEAYWKGDDGSGATLTDQEENGTYDGTISGAAWQASEEDCIWTVLTADCLGEDGIDVFYGNRGQRPTDRIARPGKMKYTLRNDAANSGSKEGYYSVSHADARAGFDVGIKTRLRIVYDGTARYKFYGKMGKPKVTPGTKRDHKVKVQVNDWIKDAADHKLVGLTLGENQRTDQLFTTVVANMTEKPRVMSFATAQETFSYVADDIKDGITKALTVFKRGTISEYGWFAVIGDQIGGGTAKFQDRHARVKDQTSRLTLANANIADMVVERDPKLILNTIKAKVYVRDVGVANEVLASMDTTLEIAAGETQTMTLNYRDPSNKDVRLAGKTMVTPVLGTDYEFSSSTGGGGDMNASLGITATYGATRVEYVLVNNAAIAGFVTILQARGLAIRIYNPIDRTKTDAESIKLNGNKPFNLNLRYQDGARIGDDFASSTLIAYKDPHDWVKSVTFHANKSDTLMVGALDVEPGQRITLQETVVGLNDEYFVNGVRLKIYNKMFIDATFYIVPAATDPAWVMGQAGNSEIGETTYVTH